MLILCIIALGSCNTKENELKTKQFTSIEGSWTYSSETVSGDFVVVKQDKDLVITSGTFNIGGKAYHIDTDYTIEEGKLLFIGANDNNLILLSTKTSADYNTIVATELEYDLETTQTIKRVEQVIVKRKL